MKRERIIEVLREHRADLRELGVRRLALFGSMARGDSGEESDIDLAATYDEDVVRDLLDLGGVAAAIESLLGTEHFDLADETQLQPHVRDAFAREHVRIF